MRNFTVPIFAALAIAGVALAAVPAEARSCFKKAAIGEASSADSARFHAGLLVRPALLQLQARRQLGLDLPRLGDAL
jgi:hypothetical protein